jgi:hypothetical protein
MAGARNTPGSITVAIASKARIDSRTVRTSHRIVFVVLLPRLVLLLAGQNSVFGGFCG